MGHKINQQFLFFLKKRHYFRIRNMVIYRIGKKLFYPKLFHRHISIYKLVISVIVCKTDLLVLSDQVSTYSIETLTQVKNIPVVLLSYLITILGKSVQGFISYDQINKQTNIDYNFMYIGIGIVKFHGKIKSNSLSNIKV